MSVSDFGGGPDLINACLRSPIGDVVADGAVEQDGLLQHKTDLAAK